MYGTKIDESLTTMRMVRTGVSFRGRVEIEIIAYNVCISLHEEADIPNRGTIHDERVTVNGKR